MFQKQSGMGVDRNTARGEVPIINSISNTIRFPKFPILSMETLDINALPEIEKFTVELKKDSCGLGITIAGYVCEKGLMDISYWQNMIKVLIRFQSRIFFLNESAFEQIRLSLYGEIFCNYNEIACCTENKYFVGTCSMDIQILKLGKSACWV